MYIIEIIVNTFLKLKKPKDTTFVQIDETFGGEVENSDDCEHIFMPIDSTKEVLACSKCGLVVNKKDLKKYNIFKI